MCTARRLSLLGASAPSHGAHFAKHLAMTLGGTPPLLSCSVRCELGVSKPRFCFAAGSLLGSANRGSQRETARLPEGKATLLLEVYACLSAAPGPPSSTPAAALCSRSSRSIQSAVCPHLQNQPHCTPHAGDTSPTCQ